MGKHIEVIAIGDINRDILMVPLHPDYESKNSDLSKERQRYLNISRDGGAILMQHTIGESLSNSELGFSEENKPEIYGYDKFKDTILKDVLGARNVLSMLKLYPRSEAAKNDQVYRLEKLCGWLSEVSYECINAIEDEYKTLLLDATIEILKESTNPKIIVINDKADLFRDLDHEKWLLNGDQYKETTFILAMDKPLCKGVLWDKLIQHGFANRLVVVVSAFALREAGINIHKSGSAEHIAHDFIMHAIQNDPHDNVVQKLLECQHVIVQLDNNEIIHCNKSINDTISIYYCPGYLLKEYSNFKKFGCVAGYTTILTTAIVLGMVSSLKNGEFHFHGLEKGIRLAAVLAKEHFERGFADINFHTDDANNGPFPFRRLFEKSLRTLRNKDVPLVSIELPAIEQKLKQWNRIEGLSCKLNKEEKNGFDIFLIKIVKEGLQEALKKSPSDKNESFFPEVNRWCPVAKFGEFEAIDRDEIDSLVDIKLLIEQYLQNEAWKTPLSLAVFGPPGSGKSFTVQEILKDIKEEEKESRPLEFNIAQFTDIKDLTVAFHSAQDKALFNNVPLVFFDEFDSVYQGNSCGWLKYFLAPMQDGVFKGRQGSYKVGRAIFVFAGGTSSTFEDFYLNKTDKEKEKFKEMKGPDFVSRLRGYLNIKGINSTGPQLELSDSLQFRRAILLRSILTRFAPQIINPVNKMARIDENFIKSLIKTKHYEHGVRSMQAIVQMSLIEKDGFHIASLPTPAQLKMHTNVDDFFHGLPH